MSWFLKITFILTLISILSLYGWLLQNKPERQESFVLKDTETLPDLTFSRLADFEQKLMTELDIIPIEDLEKFQKEELRKFENTRYDLGPQEEEKTKNLSKETNNAIEVIVLICVSVFGITVVLCLVRNFYARQYYETDLEQAPIIEASNHQDSEKSYQDEKY